MIFIDLGLTDYNDALSYQEKLFQDRLRAKSENIETAEDVILFTEHNPVFTLGKSGKISNLLLSDPSTQNIDLHYTSRGGDITFHGPGQLVVYPILDLQRLKMGLAKYVHILEESVIELLKHYNLNAMRSEGATGIWLPSQNGARERKICAIGIKASRHITMHGLALNVNTNLKNFDYIIPCGIQNKGVTSMEMELGFNLEMYVVKQEFQKLFTKELEKFTSSFQDIA